MSKNQAKKNSSMTRCINGEQIRAMNGEGNERKFVLSFSSEEPYARYFGREILDHKDGAVNLSRLEQIGCVLFNHNRDVVIGSISRVWTENNRGYAEIEFDTDEESEKIYQKVKSGTLKGVSVGYRVDVWEEVLTNKMSEDGRFSGPASIARKWMPYEISIVSVPADETVGVGRELEEIEEQRKLPSGRSLTIYESQLKVNKNYI
ncbi:MAG: HK97 family phage prohead protease [Roseburia sp.]